MRAGLIVWMAVAVLSASEVRAQASQGSTGALFEAGLRQQWAAIDDDIQLRKIDREAMAEVEKWRSGEHAPSPVTGDSGRVVFVYGSTIPRIVCAPLRICDVELQPGERIQNAMAGDNVGWVLEPATAGNTQHVVVKPQMPNITTNVAIYTDRRVYHLELQSTDKQHMPFISFKYPEDVRAKWLALAAQRGRPEARGDGVGADDEYEVSIKPGALHFGYKIEREGRPLLRRRIDWAPKRVFDDGVKTIIEMPRAILSHELPVLLVREGDGLDKIVNFRVKGQRFVVDRLFTRAVLVKGVGWRHQERVSITREED